MSFFYQANSVFSRETKTKVDEGALTVVMGGSEVQKSRERDNPYFSKDGNASLLPDPNFIL